jgi:Protein of unknown function (DUF2892)
VEIGGKANLRGCRDANKGLDLDCARVARDERSRDVDSVQKPMKTNLGTVDRIVRIVVGLAVVAAGAYYQSAWAFVGLVPLGTGLVGFCPAYCPLGLKTCGKEGCK